VAVWCARLLHLRRGLAHLFSALFCGEEDFRLPPLQSTQGWGNLFLGGADEDRASFLTSVKLTSIFLNFGIPLLAAAIAAASPAPDVHAIAQAVDEHYNHLRSLQAEFTEIYRGAGTERTESGTLWLKKPGKMRWEYRSPREKLFLSDGRDAWFYVPGERQVRRTAVKKLEDLRSPLAFLLGKTKLDKELQGLSLVRDPAPDVAPLASGDVVLRGIPRSLAGRISQVLLEITPEHWISRILIEDVDGSVTEYRFTNQRENVAVSDQQFKFAVPDGVEVIDGELAP
jgi:outer membrane lipoprotein carrier protein